MRQRLKFLFLLLGVLCIFSAVFSLYHLPLEAILYAGSLCLIMTLVAFISEYIHFLRRRREMDLLLRRVSDPVLPLPPPRDLLESDYQELLRAVCADRLRLTAENRNRLEEMTDYYTLWAHQIKTPISASRLLLQSSDLPVHAEIEAELLKIEQYVEMVLGYLRLNSDTTDYLFQECDLDEIIRQALRRLAKLFILKKISLRFQETNRQVLTDSKWLLFVIEQILSNALKYTPSDGTIRVYSDGDTLVILDTGIGIRSEDLPRVFEKGFTGRNGRLEHRSTGIGLYLCRKVMDRLNHDISIHSRPGGGTLVRLNLGRKKQLLE